MKKKFKKTAALILTGALLFSTGVFAQNDVPETNTVGTIKNILTVSEVGENYITAYEGENKDTAVMMKINDETILIDSVTATAESIKEIQIGESVLCEYSEAMTRSIPPQTNAYLIATNTQEGGSVNIIYADAVETDKNGNTVVTDNTNNIIVTVAKDAEIYPYKTKNIVSLSDIKPGSKMLMWYDIVTLSLPARAATSKVVLLPEENKVEAEITAINGADYVHIRTVFEKLGYEVKWNAADMSVTLSKDTNVTVTIGSNKVTVGDTETSMSTAALIKDDKTYVPTELVTIVTGKTVAAK